jgi:Ala-tRNA(Pro) deacylase
MPLNKVRAFLDEHHSQHVIVSHSKAFTAQGIAAITHVPGQELAKTVVVKLDGAPAMAVLPALYQVALLALKKVARVQESALASEREFKQAFPDCETGAMPPFGNLYGIPVYVDETLTREANIAFNAGTHLGVDTNGVRGLREAGEARGAGVFQAA